MEKDKARELVLSSFGPAAARYYDDHFDPNELIEFDGMNCNDFDNNYCDGWDGYSRRCSCGNRRVEWSWEGFAWDSCSNPILYATAY